VVFGFGFLLVCITCWTILSSQHTTHFIHGAHGCRYVLSEKSAIYLAVAWEASAVFDVFISALTFMRTLKMRKIHNMANSSKVGLLDLILRDGALYFLVMALANLANILSLYFAAPSSKGTFSTPAGCIASTLCSRLVLNLYEVATPDSTMDSETSYEPTTFGEGGVLTTHIELGITTDDDDRSDAESNRK